MYLSFDFSFISSNRPCRTRVRRAEAHLMHALHRHDYGPNPGTGTVRECLSQPQTELITGEVG
jgi:hypothetical protein